MIFRLSNSFARAVIAACWLYIMLLVVSCGNQQNTKKTEAPNERYIAPRTDYIGFIVSLDTLSTDDYRTAIFREDSMLRASGTETPFHHYFRARTFVLDKKLDSAQTEYELMSGDGEITLLQRNGIFAINASNGMLVEGPLMDKLLRALQEAELSKSRLTYRFYDLVAKAYYQNHNEKKSLEYAEKYYENHPFKSNPVIRQRFYDISFLLASRLEDFKKMKMYNDGARELASLIGDSTAIARTFDSEAQIYAMEGKYAKTLQYSRIYLDYLIRHNEVNDVAYNNIATSFMKNNQPDSAIYYFKAAIKHTKENRFHKLSPVYYKGLVEAYTMKGAYGDAMIAMDSAYSLEINNMKQIEAVKVAEISEKYEAEKKDRDIEELSNRNELNERVIVQQRWSLILGALVFLGVLLIFYSVHRQYRLTERNKLLESENNRLHIEQKLLQAQLNPHFIFNSIANLQSLIATGDTKESVRYLSAFSSLLRNILEQNRKEYISLDEEIASLENYLSLQQMRFEGLFDYEVKVEDEVDPEITLIPPMLLQPFAENAIEHGFRNISYKGKLTIVFKKEGQQLRIQVDDNGKGISEKVQNTQKKQSLAVVILKERLEALFRSRGQEARFDVVNKSGAGSHGVRVDIIIPEIKD
ncbi:histidine kinase [Chitinophaga skermanii]|uniref:Histidine kinase n=1 Tax=Chitinophaga skermanii TaxID=331697 RepID=A0A327QCY3_9BACT|nr:histidine kinase [Chitinophaga skermanii]RAJ02340.1 histidine kinase [Chitinophaga skermanii]